MEQSLHRFNLNLPILISHIRLSFQFIADTADGANSFAGLSKLAPQCFYMSIHRPFVPIIGIIPNPVENLFPAQRHPRIFKKIGIVYLIFMKIL